MRPLSPNDIESELSYAYLHAVAAHAGVVSKHVTRHEDNNGIDAHLTAWGPFPGGGLLNEIDLKIQLKAKKGPPNQIGNHLSYFFSDPNGHRYNDLRTDTVTTHRILVVLFLPDDVTTWLSISDDELILKKCAYWTSLRGAPASTNKTGETIYLPKNQIFDSGNLTGIFTKLSNYETLHYTKP